MKLKKLLSIPTILAILVSFMFAQPAAAHGDDPRVEISPERLNPGGVLDLRGVDFEFEEVVTLSLVGGQVEVPLGEVLADTEGIFVLSITLPPNVVEGGYVVRATTDDHVVESAPLTIWGTSDLGGSSDGPREEEDGLLAPMPTFAPGVSSTPLPQTATLETPVSRRNSTTVIYSILAGVGILALLSIRILKKR